MFKKIMQGMLIVCLLFLMVSCDDPATPSTVTITSVTPANSATNVTVGSTITIVFSTTMNTTSAEGAFSISPAVTGTFSWSGNSMIFTPSAALNYSTAYTVTISTNAKSSGGRNLNSVSTFSFTTVLKPYPNIAGVWNWVDTTTANNCNDGNAGIVVITQNEGTGTWSGYAEHDTGLTCPNKIIDYTMDRDGNLTINVTNVLLDPTGCGGFTTAVHMDFVGTFTATSTSITGTFTQTLRYLSPAITCQKSGTGTMTRRE